MTHAQHGSDPAPGSLRARILVEMIKHPGGAMVADLAVWMDVSDTQVRKAMDSLLASGHVLKQVEPGRGGGGKPPKRYFHRMYPPLRRPAPRPAPPPAPYRPSHEVIVRFGDLGPGRYPALSSWVDNYLGGAQ